MTKGRPPAFRREKSALKPMDVKKMSMNASCSGFQFEADAVGFVQGEQDDSGNQRATGSGILKSRKNLIF